MERGSQISLPSSYFIKMQQCFPFLQWSRNLLKIRSWSSSDCSLSIARWFLMLLMIASYVMTYIHMPSPRRTTYCSVPPSNISTFRIASSGWNKLSTSCGRKNVLPVIFIGSTWGRFLSVTSTTSANECKMAPFLIEGGYSYPHDVVTCSFGLDGSSA